MKLEDQRSDQQHGDEVIDLEPSVLCPTCRRHWDGKPAQPVHLAALLTYDPTGWDKVQEIIDGHRSEVVRILRQLAEEQHEPEMRALAHEAADRFEAAPDHLIG